MNEKFSQLEILDSSSPNGQTPGGGSNKWFNVIVIVFILLVAGVFAMFQLGALSVSDLIKKDDEDVMVFNTTSSTESTTMSTISTSSTGINGTTIGTTTTSRITWTTTTAVTHNVSSEIQKLYNNIKESEDKWDCNDTNLSCTKKEKHGETYYVLVIDLINLNFKLKNDEESNNTYEYTYDFRKKNVEGYYDGVHLKYNSNQSFFVYDDQGNSVKGQQSTLAIRTETYAGYYVNKNGSLVARLVE